MRLETRPPNIEGKGEVTQRELVRNALRMRPDRIIVGEVRGAEALDMLQAMNTGHEGSMTTIHANTPRDALARLENMVGMAGVNLTPRAMRQQICSALTVVLQVTRLTDGARKLVSMQEITGMEGDVIAMQEMFRFEQTGVDADGKVLGHFRATGVRPRFADRLRLFGVAVPDTRLRSRAAVSNSPGAVMNILFYSFAVLLFAAVILLIEGAYLWWSGAHGSAARRIARRLRLMAGDARGRRRAGLDPQAAPYAKTEWIDRYLRRLRAGRTPSSGCWCRPA